MDFLGIGGWEILLIMIVALVLWGPGRLVEIARTMGKIASNLRKITSELTNQISKELDEEKKADADKSQDGHNP